MSFGTMLPSGGQLSFDSHSGPTPMEALLCSLAACTAMDVVSILEKKRQKLTSYRLEITGDRPAKGTYPRPFTKITVKHVFSGQDLDQIAITRAIQLSDEKYCSVSMTLKAGVDIESNWTIE